MCLNPCRNPTFHVGRSIKALITNAASAFILRGYEAPQSKLLCSTPGRTLVINGGSTRPSHHTQTGVCRGAYKGAGSIRSTIITNGKGVCVWGGEDGKCKQEPSQGRGPKQGGDPGSASRENSIAPPTNNNPLGYLSPVVQGKAPLRPKITLMLNLTTISLITIMKT